MTSPKILRRTLRRAALLTWLVVQAAASRADTPDAMVGTLVPSAASAASSASSVSAASATSADLVRALRGGWAGRAIDTPEGPMPFAFLFEVEDDGSLRARTHRDRLSFIDLHFIAREDGGADLVQTAGLSGLGVQSSVLHPVAVPPEGIVRFASPGDGQAVVVDFALTGDRLALDVSLGGEPHAAFRLSRLPEQGLESMRSALADLALREPEDAEAAAAAAVDGDSEQAEPDLDEALEAARARSKERPDDARAQLELGAAVMRVLSERPEEGMLLSGECLSSLRRAAALDPQLAEPHRLLSLYALQAPAIGGGSTARAVDEARVFAELDPERGPEFLRQVEQAVAARGNER